MTKPPLPSPPASSPGPDQTDVKPKPVANGSPPRRQEIDVPVAKIAFGSNVRTEINLDSLAELAADMEVHGQLQAIGVRKLHLSDKGYAKGNDYETVFGNRRLRAAEKLGWPTIRAIDLSSDSKGDLFIIQLKENMEREQLTPGEEAEGLAQAVKEFGWTHEKLAELLGRKRAFIYARLRMAKLTPAVKKAAASYDLSATHLEMIATIPDEKQQLKAVQEIGEKWTTWDNGKETFTPMSVRETQELIAEKYRRDLKKATWDLDDAGLLPAAGPCTKCPYRSANFDPDLPNKNTCVKPACFAKKEQAAIDRALAAKVEAGCKLVPKGEGQHLFNRWGGANDLREDSGYVKPNDKPAGSKKTYAEIAKEHEKPIHVALNKNKTPVNLVKVADVLEHLPKEAKKQLKDGLSSSSRGRFNETPEQKKKREEKEAFDKEVEEKLADQLFQLIVKDCPAAQETALWRFVASQNWEAKRKLKQATKPGEIRALGFSCRWSRYAEEKPRKELLKAFGLDAEKVRKEVIAARAAAQSPKSEVQSPKAAKAAKGGKK